MTISPLQQTDYYKVNHYNMYPKGTTKIYSNLTPRRSRIEGVNSVVVFGIQYWILEYVIKQWNENFFGAAFRVNPHSIREEGENIFLEAIKTRTIAKYKRMMDSTLGPGAISYEHIEQLWDLGYMPLHIKALPEGSLCPIGVPMLTITNTVDHAYWLVNYLETILSCSTWQAMTSATISYEYRKLGRAFAQKTNPEALDFVNWQFHDFSMRGMSSLESACLSGAGHLLSSNGTDTIPAISFLEQYYGADVEKELVGSSVPATEHSVMCMGTKDDELGTFKALLDKYPKGILSVVSDTWDLWKVANEYLPALKDQILSRDGKLVIRPDSGDPVRILCGYDLETEVEERRGNTVKLKNGEFITIWERKGLIQLLWDTFGGTITSTGHKQLDSHIGAIYGDSITLDRARSIFERLERKGFASTNIVLGIGSFTFQYNTRDTFGFAVKATYGEVKEYCPTFQVCHNGNDDCVDMCMCPVPVGRELFKDPVTDDGTKKSAKGLLQVIQTNNRHVEEHGQIWLKDQCTQEEEKQGLLETVFLNGKLVKFQTLAEIKERLSNS
jgi:nicotinamide phosphoribosyltransferase